MVIDSIVWAKFCRTAVFFGRNSYSPETPDARIFSNLELSHWIFYNSNQSQCKTGFICSFVFFWEKKVEIYKDKDVRVWGKGEKILLFILFSLMSRGYTTFKLFLGSKWHLRFSINGQRNCSMYFYIAFKCWKTFLFRGHYFLLDTVDVGPWRACYRNQW